MHILICLFFLIKKIIAQTQEKEPEVNNINEEIADLDVVKSENIKEKTDIVATDTEKSEILTPQSIKVESKPEEEIEEEVESVSTEITEETLGEYIDHLFAKLFEDLEFLGESLDYDMVETRLKGHKIRKFTDKDPLSESHVSLGPFINKNGKATRSHDNLALGGFGAAQNFPGPNNASSLRSLLASLTALQIEKRRESQTITNSLTNRFLTKVLEIITNGSTNFKTQLNSVYAGLNNTILSIIGTQLSAQGTNIISSINTGNAAIASAVQGAIANGNSQITQIITELSTTTQANIVAVVQNFTSSTGLLPQLLAILNSISTTASTAVFNTLQSQLASINSNINTTNTAIQQQITDAINTANTSINSLIRAGIGQLAAEVIKTFNIFVLEMVNSQNFLLSDWSNTVVRLVRNAKRNEPLFFETRFADAGEPGESWNASLGATVTIQTPANGLPLPLISSTQ